MIEKYDEITNRKIRVFISSTFHDMHLEREVIVNKVFPRLRKELKERMIEICDIDLRWGIPDSISDDGRILEICLGEVIKCNPFFVGMLGNRYGYIPEESDIEKLSLELRKSLGAGRLTGISITELEIRAGVFVPASKVYASLHLRNGIDPATTDNPEKMQDLLDRIKKFRRCKQFQYDTLDELEQQVYQSVLIYINSIFPEEYESPFNDTDYYSHLNLLKDHYAKYMPEPAFTYELIDAVNDYSQVVLYGRKGIGKTSTMSFLIKSFGVDEDEDVFFHYTSLGGDNNTIQKLYYRLFLFLNYQYELKLNHSENISETQILEILSNIKLPRTLYIFVDAIDKLAGNRNYLVQIGNLSDINPDVRVICSCTDDRKFGFEKIVEMPDLTNDQIQAIVETQFRQYGKIIEHHKIQVMFDNPLCHNPLFLSILINELRVYGAYEKFNDFFDAVVTIDSLGKLFNIIFNRLYDFLDTNNYDTKYVYQVFALLLCTKNGISESEIFSITKMPPIIWVVIFSSLERFLFETNGILSLNHDLVRDEMDKILVSGENGPSYIKWARNAIISYFESVDDISREAVELTHQYYFNKDYERLITFILRPPVFKYLYENEFYTLITYFNSVQAHQEHLIELIISNIKDIEKNSLSVRFSSILCQSGCFQACIKIGNLLLEHIDSPVKEISILSDIARSEYKLNLDGYYTAAKCYESLINKYSVTYPEDETGLCEHLFKYAIVCSSRGEIDKAIGIYEQVVKTYKDNGVSDMLSSWAMGNLANCYYAIGFQSKGEPLFIDAINTRVRIFGEFSPEVAWEYCYYWPNLYADFKIEEAMSTVTEAKKIYSHYFNGTGLELAWALTNYANMLTVYGNYDEAVKYYNDSIEMNDAVLEPGKRPHVYSLTTYNNLANVYFLKGDTEKARQQLEITYNYKLKHHGDNHPYTVNTIVNMATLTQDTNTAIALYEKGIQLLNNSYHKNSIDSYFIYVCLGIRCINSNLREAAGRYLLTAYEIRQTKGFDITIIDYLLAAAAEKAEIEIVLNLNYSGKLPSLLYLSHNNESELLIIPQLKP